MRNWGIAITAFYAAAVVLLLVPGGALLAGMKPSEFSNVYREWVAWVPIGVVVCGQGILLFLSVDASQKRLKPRAHVLVTCWTAAILCALLTFAILFSVTVGFVGDNGINLMVDDSKAALFAWWGGLWLFWGILFYLYWRASTDVVSRAMSWLLKGSVLELLVIVPCHIVVRRRDDCSAPAVTGFGIATGIAVMLLSFGPSVLLLYKKRLDSYKNPPPATPR
jgi:hypothetical protein